MFYKEFKRWYLSIRIIIEKLNILIKLRCWKFKEIIIIKEFIIRRKS